MMGMLLSIVAPVYKEEKNIPEFLRRLQPILAPITADYEIIFSMDPSPDCTERIGLEARAGEVDRADRAQRVVGGQDHAEGHDLATVNRVWRLLEGAEYKRRQAPLGVKITSRLISRERRYPIVNGFRG